MDFLSVHEVRKIAARKGYAIERNSVVKNVTFVRLTDPDGADVHSPGGMRGLTLAAAKRLLDALPDPSPVRGPRPQSADRRGARRSR